MTQKAINIFTLLTQADNSLKFSSKDLRYCKQWSRAKIAQVTSNIDSNSNWQDMIEELITLAESNELWAPWSWLICGQILEQKTQLYEIAKQCYLSAFDLGLKMNERQGYKVNHDSLKCLRVFGVNHQFSTPANGYTLGDLDVPALGDEFDLIYKRTIVKFTDQDGIFKFKIKRHNGLKLDLHCEHLLSCAESRHLIENAESFPGERIRCFHEFLVDLNPMSFAELRYVLAQHSEIFQSKDWNSERYVTSLDSAEFEADLRGYLIQQDLNGKDIEAEIVERVTNQRVAVLAATSLIKELGARAVVLDHFVLARQYPSWASLTTLNGLMSMCFDFGLVDTNAFAPGYTRFLQAYDKARIALTPRPA